MALHEGDYDCVEYLAHSSNIGRGNEENSLLARYEDVVSERFRGARAFKAACTKREQNFRDGSMELNEYIRFTGVSLEDMKIVDRVRGSLVKMCCLYDAAEEVLIVKLMVGVGHEGASVALLIAFSDKFRDFGLRREIQCSGSSRFGDPRRYKEPDQSFKPRRTRPAPDASDAWPSLTFEIGFSESLRQLRNDAWFWLTQSRLQTRIVLVVHIDRVQREIRIERWEVINSRRVHRANAVYSPSVGCVQTIELRRGGVYVGPPLHLALDKIFDIVPPNVAPGTLDFTTQDLQEFNDTFWEDFP